jgi:hypothetical protein
VRYRWLNPSYTSSIKTYLHSMRCSECNMTEHRRESPTSFQGDFQLYGSQSRDTSFGSMFDIGAMVSDSRNAKTEQ